MDELIQAGFKEIDAEILMKVCKEHQLDFSVVIKFEKTFKQLYKVVEKFLSRVVSTIKELVTLINKDDYMERNLNRALYSKKKRIRKKYLKRLIRIK